MLTALMMNYWTILVVVLALPWIQETSTQINNCQSTRSQRIAATLVAPPPLTNNTPSPWSACSYPNPRHHWLKCGRSHRSLLCDPDGLLSQTEADEIENLLTDVHNDTSCRCEADCGVDGTGTTIGVALLRKMRLPDMLGLYCKDWRCGEVYPALDTSLRRPTALELRQGMQDFGQHLSQRAWRFGRCDDHVVIIYNQEFQQLAIVPGETLDDVLGRKRMLSVAGDALKHLKEGRVKDGLKHAIEQCSRALQYSPAWPLVVGILCALLTCMIVLIGVATTAMYCRSEVEQGQTPKEVLFSTVHGWWTFLFAGNPPLHSEPRETIPVVFTNSRGNVTFGHGTLV